MPVVFDDHNAVLSAAATLAAAKIQARGGGAAETLAHVLEALVDRGLIAEIYRPAPEPPVQQAMMHQPAPDLPEYDPDEESWRTV